MRKPNVVVVGAGAFGGWTALQLQRLGADVTLVDAFGAGHTRSSSGGETRVIRAIYGPDRVYTEMVKRSFDLWEALPESVYVETGVLWMMHGDDGYVRSSVPILRDVGFDLDQVPVDAAAKRWPQINFDGVQSAWFEPRAGALFARRACGVVRDLFVKNGGTFRVEAVKPEHLIESGEADAYVFACGSWLGKLFPDVIGDRIVPTRQEVYYFGTPRGSDRFSAPHFPIWVDFDERIVYGIPDIHARGFKVADDTRGDAIDPTTANRTPSAEGIDRARQLLAKRFPELKDAPLIASEVCQYENSPDGNMILDRHPHANNVWIAGGGSGHGFKLSPAVGELLAQAIVNGKAVPAAFGLARLNEAHRETQFERKQSGRETPFSILS
ncbi:MAG TPA: FAD-dependent oxidoreductase [Thermoanaerobaculia bacterium]|nr:FAD-dependent oxidoreductase [Thermoanaerobaculia bacterium]